MKTKQTTKKWAYKKPEITVVAVETCQLLESSFPSQHNPANPGNGPAPSNAKQGFFFDEEEDF